MKMYNVYDYRNNHRETEITDMINTQQNKLYQILRDCSYNIDKIFGDDDIKSYFETKMMEVFADFYNDFNICVYDDVFTTFTKEKISMFSYVDKRRG